MNEEFVGYYATPIAKHTAVKENDTLTGALGVIKESLHRSEKGGAWRGHRLVVVVDDMNEPTGLLTVRNILKAIKVKMLVSNTYYKAEFDSWYFLERASSGGYLTVREIMRPIGAISIDYYSSIFKAARLFSRCGFNYLPVLEDGKIYGILNSRELFYGYYELNRFQIAQDPEAGPSKAGKLAKGYATV
ncbi:CBS domain-containing protein [Desulfotomaculum arcticum]|uniref:CBS domain-containing protein n=1 Tax=Desulfotruncus arcticus DSM 17038 TaxID=1121424 RepID=A0A1I2TZF0_9FIRM|nr:CBS domain-containing protein [Desulfotruncus arcticus]SFG70282.1 CBS domain-containing protein [Desulfotomaculum arcticum] [Desulfotruncus arcticus DSM 17038]